MTPKEARAAIRYEISTLKSEQLEAKKALSQPHTPESAAIMGTALYRSWKLSLYHNALNELCGRKLSHTYKDGGYRPHVASEHIKSIKAGIVWPEKTPTVV